MPCGDLLTTSPTPHPSFPAPIFSVAAHDVARGDARPMRLLTCPSSPCRLGFARAYRAASTGPARVEGHVKTILSFGTRVAGSQSRGHRRTRDYITECLRRRQWAVEHRSHTQPTVRGAREFHNVIATKRLAGPGTAPAGPCLVLAAHYDSLDLPGCEFLGATDAVVPVALLLKIGETLGAARPPGYQRDLKLVFFDGEEALRSWSRTDSLYGSRRLAQDWDREGVLPRVELLVLLDLLGAPRPAIPCAVPETYPHFRALVRLEEALRADNALRSDRPIFQLRLGDGLVEDDHVPFRERGVPCMLLIPAPFPTVWHTPDDTLEALDWDVIHDIEVVVERFVHDCLVRQGPL